VTGKLRSCRIATRGRKPAQHLCVAGVSLGLFALQCAAIDVGRYRKSM
jgi:hypothetical protein